MKAAVNLKYGPPSVITIKELEKPTPQDNQVLIRVYAATINRTDCAILQAKPFIMRLFTGFLKPKRKIQGTDFAGKIESVGKHIKSFKEGDRVFGYDDTGISSHAQYMTLSEKTAFSTIPDGTSYEQAAASLDGVHYAYNFFNRIKISSDQKVLVNGATGAIGSAMVQLLKNYNARVTAVGNTENIELIKSLGAESVIDYKQEDFTQLNEKFYFIFDTVGKSSFPKCKRLLEDGGVYISSELGWMAQNLIFSILTPIFGRKKVIFPFPSDRLRSILFIKKLIEEGKFTAVIDREYPLEEIADAYKYVLKGEKTGNVIITF